MLSIASEIKNKLEQQKIKREKSEIVRLKKHNALLVRYVKLLQKDNHGKEILGE